MLVWRWPIVYDAGPTSAHYWTNASSLLARDPWRSSGYFTKDQHLREHWFFSVAKSKPVRCPSAKPKGGICSPEKEADTAFWLWTTECSPWFAFTVTACSEINSPNRCNAVRPVTSLVYGEPLWMWLTAEVSTTLTNELSSVRTVWLMNLDVLGGRHYLITITELSPCCQQHYRKQSSGSMLHQRHRVLAQR